jgi:nitrile hydratase accessory protein
MTDDRSRSGHERDGPSPKEVEVLSELPFEADDPLFEAPWQARAFAIAVVLSDYEEDVYSWKDFQSNLVEEVQSAASTKDLPDDANASDSIAGSEAVYYEQWLRALERVLLEKGLVDAEEMRGRIREFADGDRDASEFVEGEHAHDHDHPHPHPDEHDHDHGHTEP